MTPTQTIRIALDMGGEMTADEPKVKAAARKMEAAGEVKIETYSANCVRGGKLIVREGYRITPR